MPICNPQPHQFDKMAKALTSAVSRRDAFKYVGAGVLGSMLVSVGVAEAARIRCQPNTSCTNQTICTPSGNGGQCGCTHKTSARGVVRPFCWQNQFCSGLTACATSRDCKPLGRNWKCADSCCGGGFCLPKCGSVPPCCSTQSSGATARG
jgi:hypothetical protein